MFISGAILLVGCRFCRCLATLCCGQQDHVLFTPTAGGSHGPSNFLHRPHKKGDMLKWRRRQSENSLDSRHSLFLG